MQKNLLQIIKDGTGNLLKEGSIYHIYPFHIPDGKIPANALIYNILNETINFGKRNYEIQLTAVAKDYSALVELVEQVSTALSNKRYTGYGNIYSSFVKSIITLGFDKDNEYYLSAINIFVKTD